MELFLWMFYICSCLILNVFSDSCEFGSTKYFALCGLGGILSCGITHTAIVPLDLVKCRIQVNPAKYRSIVNGFQVSFQYCFLLLTRSVVM
jgi:solute carrier family 25 phosphate transporter 3